MQNIYLGIDIGGTGIKGALVDVDKGELITDRYKIPTPEIATPAKVTEVVKELVNYFDYDGVVGCGFPTIMVNGVAKSYGNIHKSWKGTNVAELFTDATGLTFCMCNDADIAGVCEMRYGIGRGKKGKVILITIGTGLGSAVFQDGVLVPNTELGFQMYKGEPIERFASNSARERDGLEYEEWGSRFDFFLHATQRVMNADIYILGGGSSKKFDQFEDKLTIDVPIVIAEKLNNAGIIGAAYHASVC